MHITQGVWQKSGFSTRLNRKGDPDLYFLLAFVLNLTRKGDPFVLSKPHLTLD
jgi:hypothetical protein